MTRQHILLGLTALALTSWVPRAEANGNYSHLWMAEDGLSFLEEGALRDLLTRPELLDILRNGAMFPDGGYAVEDGYGEIAHWEPFHTAYLEWIRETFSPPWSDEAAQHIAFLMGMAAHGMSDQLYDGMFLTRHKHFDENGDEATLLGVDGATDACFAATQGPMEPPERWVPAEVLAPIFATLGHEVEPATIEQGQLMVGVAVMAADDARKHPEVIAEYTEIYPYACGNQDNPAAPGSPVTHGPVLARYWQVLWDRLQGDEGFAQPLLGTFATGCTLFDVPTDASTPDAWVTFVMPRGLTPSTINADTVTVLQEDQAVEVGLNVYYGTHSHLVNIKPMADWALDTEYTVTVAPPVESWDGVALETPRSFSFSTGPAPAVVDEDLPGGDVVERVDTSPDTMADTGLMDVTPGPPLSTQPAYGCTAQPTGSAGALGLLVLLSLVLLSRRRTQSVT